MKRLLLFIVYLGLATCSLVLGAETNPARLAVIAEGTDAAPFADLLLAEIGALGDVKTVERAELDRLAGEASLAALNAEQRPLATAKLAGAQALLFVRLNASADGSVVVLRLSTIADGTVRRSLVLPWVPAEIAANAKMAARQFQPDLANLRTGAAQPLYVSLLGLRSALDSTRLSSFEVALNTLLAHRLASESGFVVLERWRMDDLVFERALQPLGIPQFQSGSLLIDGSFAAQGTQFRLRLRTRTAEKAEGQTREVTGATAAALVDAVVALLKESRPNAAGQARPWAADQEARNFANLGEWLLKFNLHAEGAQAIESAIALGLNDARARGRRIWAYGQCAYPDSGMGFQPLDQGYAPGKISKRENLPYHLAAAQRACEYALELLTETTTIPEAPPTEQPKSLSLLTFHKTVRLLRATESLRQPGELADAIEAARYAVTRLMARMDSTSEKGSVFYLNYKAHYAAYWCGSPEATLAYYRQALAPGYSGVIRQKTPVIFSAEVRDTLLARRYSAPFLDRPPQSMPEKFDIGPVRLLDWRNPDPTRIATLWKDFLRQLKEDVDLTSQADGMGLELASHVDPANRQRLQKAMADWLWAHREAIGQASNTRLYSSMRLDALMLARERDCADSFDHLVAFLLEVLGRADWLPESPFLWLENFAAAGPNMNLSPAQTRDLLDAMERYRQRRESDGRWTPPYSQIVMKAVHALRRMPQVDPIPVPIPIAPTNGEALPVTRAWVPARRLPTDPSEPPSVKSEYLERPYPQGNRVFFNSTQGVVALDLETLESTLTPPLEGSVMNWRIYPTAQDIWASDWNTLLRISRKGSSGAWEKVDVPPGLYRIYSAGDRVFAQSRPTSTRQTDGYGLYELLPTGSKLIFSTRRRPAQHPLDERPFGDFRSVFAGLGNEPWLGVFGAPRENPGVFFHSLERPAEPVLKTPGWFPVIKTDGAITLLTERAINREKGNNLSMVGLWRIDPSKSAPELLLRDAARSIRPESNEPRWALPSAFTDPEVGTFPSYSPITHGEELWILRWLTAKSDTYSYATDLELYGFIPGRKAPIRIPLQLVVSPADLAALQRTGGRVPSEALTRLPLVNDCITCTDYGIAIGANNIRALWIVPWDDLKAWRNLHR